MPQRPKYSRARENSITRALEKLAQIIKRLQKSLFDSILDFFFDRFDTEDRKIKKTARNYTIVNTLDDFYQNWNEANKKTVIDHLIKSITGLHKHNTDYFGEIADRPIDKDGEKIFKNLMTRLGYDPGRRKLTRGGYIDSILNSDDPIMQVKLLSLRAIVSGESLTDFKKKMDILMRGTDNGDGLLEKHYGEHLYEVFQQYDREVGRLLAEALGLKFAIYQGGLIQTSRPFCIERNDKVFTAEEISKFGTPQDQYGGYENKSIGYFQGKPRIYNPFLDLGGYNCRHLLDWVSNELGEILRLQQDAKSDN